MRPVLPFVVTDAASINGIVLNRGLEGRRFPEIKGFGRLHIVVAVDEKMWALRFLSFGFGSARGSGDEDWRSGCRVKIGFESTFPELIQDPVRASLHIWLMFWLSGHAWETHIFDQAIYKRLPIVVEVTECFFHRFKQIQYSRICWMGL